MALGAVAVALVSTLLSYVLAAAVLLAGGVVVFLLYQRDVAARTIRLTYNLEGEYASKFAAVQEVCKGLSGAKKVWRVEGDAESLKRPPSDGEGLSGKGALRYPAEVGLLETPGIWANVEIWGIKTDVASLFYPAGRHPLIQGRPLPGGLLQLS